jgi:hypothetical protein
MKKKIILGAFAIAVLAVSCDKEKSTPSTTSVTYSVADRTELLCKLPWKQISGLLTTDSIVNKETIESCEKDDLTTFSKNGLVFFKGGTQLCTDESSVSNDTLNWKFDATASNLIMYKAGSEESYTYKINTLSNEKLVVLSDYSEAGKTIKYQATFTH